MAHVSYEVHVGQVVAEGLRARGSLEGPGEVPTVVIETYDRTDDVFAGPTATITLFVWATPSLAFDQLDQIIDACADAKRALIERVARDQRSAEMHPGLLPRPEAR